MKPRLVTLAIIALAAASRLLPHPPNVTPLTAIALLGGAYLPAAYALTAPVAALLLSDLFLGFHGTMPFVYASFLATGLIGLWLSSRRRPGMILSACLASSVLFFIVTNFGTWLTAGLYPKDFSGLAACYTAAIPFFGKSLLGDLSFTCLLFGMESLGQTFLVRAQKPAV